MSRVSYWNDLTVCSEPILISLHIYPRTISIYLSIYLTPDPRRNKLRALSAKHNFPGQLMPIYTTYCIDYIFIRNPFHWHETLKIGNLPIIYLYILNTFYYTNYRNNPSQTGRWLVAVTCAELVKVVISVLGSCTTANTCCAPELKASLFTDFFTSSSTWHWRHDKLLIPRIF